MCHTGPLERGNACQCPGSPATASQAAPAPTGTTIMHLIKSYYGSSARSIRAQESGVGRPVVGGKRRLAALPPMHIVPRATKPPQATATHTRSAPRCCEGEEIVRVECAPKGRQLGAHRARGFRSGWLPLAEEEKRVYAAISFITRGCKQLPPLASCYSPGQARSPHPGLSAC
jgi:hypothetical protein